MSDAMLELLPCPFCGEDLAYLSCSPADMYPSHYVYCSECGGRAGGPAYKRGEALDAWNRRPL